MVNNDRFACRTKLSKVEKKSDNSNRLFAEKITILSYLV
jgi:hypothetical protein